MIFEITYAILIIVGMKESSTSNKKGLTMTTKNTTKDSKLAKDSKPAKDIHWEQLRVDDNYQATMLDDDYKPLVDAIDILMDGKDLPEYDTPNGTGGMLQQYKESWSYTKLVKEFKKNEMLDPFGSCWAVYGPRICELKKIYDKLPLSAKQLSWIELSKNGLYQEEFEQLITLFVNTVRLLKLFGYDEFSKQLASIIKLAVSRSPYYTQEKMGLLIQYCTGLLQLLSGMSRIEGGCGCLLDTYNLYDYLAPSNEQGHPLYRLYIDNARHLSVSYLPLVVQEKSISLATNTAYRLSCEFNKPLDQPKEFNSLAIKLNDGVLTSNCIVTFFDEHRLTGDVIESMLTLRFDQY